MLGCEVAKQIESNQTVAGWVCNYFHLCCPHICWWWWWSEQVLWPVSSVMSPPTLVTSSLSTWVTSHSSSPDTQSLQTQTLCLSYQTINKLIAFKMNQSHLTLPAKSILCFLLHCVSLPAKVKPNNCIRSTISNDQESCWNNPVLDKLLCLDRKNWN